MDKCYFLGLYAFPDGSCAQWFSGFASTTAVIVALGANFYSAWRQSRTDARSDAAEIASISMLLRILFKEANANVKLLTDSCKEIEFLDRNYLITRPFGGVGARQISFLNKGQADVLLRYSQAELAELIDIIVGSINLANLGIEDHSRIRKDIGPDLSSYGKLKKLPRFGRSKIIEFSNKLQVLSSSVTYLQKSSGEIASRTVNACQMFNVLCNEHSAFLVYRLNLSQAALSKTALAAGSREERG